MKPYHSAVLAINGILLVLFGWLCWLGYGYLPGQLDGQMAGDVMLMKYRIVCARLASYLTAGCFVVIVAVNVVLLRACFSSWKDRPATASSDA
ncbi:MAG: hypothetical protein ACYTAS_14525 [Planctomycetota bacterium]|jgi:hypothetical protein